MGTVGGGRSMGARHVRGGACAQSGGAKTRRLARAFLYSHRVDITQSPGVVPRAQRDAVRVLYMRAFCSEKGADRTRRLFAVLADFGHGVPQLAW